MFDNPFLSDHDAAHSHNLLFFLSALLFFPAFQFLVRHPPLRVCFLPSPLFPLCFAFNSLEIRCVPAVFSFRVLSNCPVHLPSLSVHACLPRYSVGMRLLVLRPGLEGNLHRSDTDNDKCTPRPDCCIVSCV